MLIFLQGLFWYPCAEQSISCGFWKALSLEDQTDSGVCMGAKGALTIGIASSLIYPSPDLFWLAGKVLCVLAICLQSLLSHRKTNHWKSNSFLQITLMEVSLWICKGESWGGPRVFVLRTMPKYLGFVFMNLLNDHCKGVQFSCKPNLETKKKINK